MRRVFRQVDRGERVELRKVPDELLWHYEDHAFATPLSEGWREVAQWQANWDGGPGLRRVVRVRDLDAPFDPAFDEAVMARAEAIALALVDDLRPWGAEDPRVFVWQLGKIDDIGNASDVLQHTHTIVRELGIDHIDVIPVELDDPYGAFGPNGPPSIPRAMVGRRLSQLPDPLARVAELRALGVHVSLAGDEVRLAIIGTST